MLLFITAAGHSYTVKSLVERAFGAETPHCQVTTYDDLFQGTNTLSATHIFTDLERLYDWELALAADLYRSIREVGLPCLNDPARTMCRYQLLRELHAAGINPFTAYRADDRPQPVRFPVFLRSEAGHRSIDPYLIPDQPALDLRLRMLRDSGTPLRGLIVVEYASEPTSPGVWGRYQTWRLGDAVLVGNGVWEDKWEVRYGTYGLATERRCEEERAAVDSNCFAEQLKPAFQIAGVEWGRADHATFKGREIVYEVNTNPNVAPLQPQQFPFRDETLLFFRKRMAKQLWQINFGDGASVPFRPSDRLMEYGRRNHVRL
jgi:hypothetical protein